MPRFNVEQIPSLEGKVAIVTGGNTVSLHSLSKEKGGWKENTRGFHPKMSILIEYRLTDKP